MAWWATPENKIMLRSLKLTTSAERPFFLQVSRATGERAHIHNQENPHSRVAANKCPFNRPRKTWEPNITQDGSKVHKITNRGHLWSNHFFRERRRAWAGLSRSCKGELGYWSMQVFLEEKNQTNVTLSSFWRCSTLRQGPILLFTRLIISCLVRIRNLRPSTSLRAKLVTRLEHSFTWSGYGIKTRVYMLK